MFEDAIKSQKCNILNPNSAQLQSNLGISLNDLGKFNDASEAHKKSITLNPNDAYSYYNFGGRLTDQGNLTRLLGYEKAISLNLIMLMLILIWAIFLKTRQDRRN